MKKIIIFLFCITLCIFLKNDKEVLMIPEESIRFRVIANSDSLEDQTIKMTIKQDVETKLNKLMQTSKNITEAREKIENEIPNIKEILNQYHISYELNFGNNLFPEKVYKGVTYPSGEYESLVITLGSGKGENWWCVMFPPLCLLEAEKNNINDVEYKLWVQEILKSFSMN